jgi:xanthine dehydrogenase iron-sulfur cluster and FAD-binding subunit A
VRRFNVSVDFAFAEHCMALATTLTVNGVIRTILLDDPRVTLLDLLRERLDLTGTKKRVATAANAVLAPSSSTDDGSIRALHWRSVMTVPRS